MNFLNDDELTDADLKFLNQWGQMGQSDTADSEYKPEDDLYAEVGEGGTEADAKIPDGSGEGDEEGEVDQSIEGDEEGGEEGDRIDESKMDLSDVESGDSDSTHGDLEGEDEPELEAPKEGDDRLSDISDTDDDDLDFDDSDISDADDDVDDLKNDTELSDDAEDRDQLKNGDTDSDIPEGESDLEYDDLENWSGDPDQTEGYDENADEDEGDESGEIDHEHAQAEEEFGDGERGNTESEIEDLSEYEQKRNEHQDNPEHDSDADNTELDAEEREQELNAEGESEFEGDAQHELENHLHDEQGKQPEDEITVEQVEDEQQSEEPSGLFGDLPEPDHRCENHCEDNPLDDDEIEECEHCKARLEKERELWGTVAQDKHGNDLLPGDKIRVVIPMPFTTLHTILTVNVPNLEVDPQRVAQSTAGEIDPEVCWLSGHAMSNFTGWHMSHDGAIWTFKKGKKLRFAEKIGEPEFQRHGSNDLDGDQLDAEDLIEKFKNELDELPDAEPEAESENNDEENGDNVDDSGSDEDAEGEGDESQGDDNSQDEDDDDSEDGSDDDLDENEEKRRRNSDQLTGAQKLRFENLTNRILKKIEGTFGNTLERIEIQNIEDRGSYVRFGAKIISRGLVFGIGMTMRKVDLELDGA